MPEAFRVGPLRVQPVMRASEDGERPFVEVSQTARRPDGSEKTQSFLFAFDRLCEMVHKVRQVFSPEERLETFVTRAERAELDQVKPTTWTEPAQADQRWWPTVRPIKILGDGLLVKVEGCYPNRAEAELRAHEFGHFAWHHGFETRSHPGDYLLSDSGKNPPLDAQRAKVAEGQLSLLKLLQSGQVPDPAPPAKPEWWPVVRLRETVKTGAIVEVVRSFPSSAEAELFAFKHSRYFAFPQSFPSEPAKGERLTIAGDETTKITKRVEAARKLAEVHRRNQPPPDLKAVSLTPELRDGTRPIRSVVKGDLRADLIERVGEDGKPRRFVLITRPVRDDQGRTRMVTTEESLAHFRARRAERAEMAKETPTRQEEPKTTEELKTAEGPKPKPISSGPPSGYEAAIELAVERRSRHFVAAAWDWGDAPRKGMAATLTHTTRWAQDEQGRWQPKEADPKATPLACPKPAGQSPPGRFVVLKKTEVDGVYLVIGYTRDKALAVSRANLYERERQAMDRQKLDEMRGQKPEPQRPQQEPSPGRGIRP